MDARPSGCLLNGHSSGGWATLQLQVNYPNVFGGTWSTSPDPSDFHDFTGPDLYAASANLYHRANGTAVPIFRDKGKVIATMEQLAGLEDVLGPHFSGAAENRSADLQIGCPEGLPALRDFARR